MSDEEEVVVEEVETPTEWYTEDWRQKMAGDDEKALAQLGRYKTPGDVWNKARALEQRITSGELKDMSPFPGEGTDDEKSAWRTSNNVPEAYDKYELKQDLDDDAKATLDSFLQHAYANNYNTDMVNGMVDYFIAKYDGDVKSNTDADGERKTTTEDALRAEWAGDYRGHMNRIDGLLDMVAEGKGTEVLEARMADGSMLRDSPEAMNFLLEAALAVNPATALAPSGEMGSLDSIQDEMADIRSKMGTPAYTKNVRMQERYTTLLRAQESLSKKRGTAA